MNKLKNGLKGENIMKTKSNVQTKLATHILHEANRIYNDPNFKHTNWVRISV